MTGKAKIKLTDIPTIIKLYGLGKSTKDIGERFGVSSARIGKILRDNFVEMRNGNGKTRAEVNILHSKIRELYDKNYTLQQIADKLNVSEGCISYVLYTKPKKVNKTTRKTMSFTNTPEKTVVMDKFDAYLKDLKKMGVSHDAAAIAASNMIVAENMQYIRTKGLDVDASVIHAD